jgi:uridine kinase
MIIGIGGMSRSGKTTLAHQIAAGYTKGTVVVLSLDDYAVPKKDIPMVRDMIDWEHPESIDFDRFYLDVFDAGHQYDLVIAEGFLIYLHEPLRNLFDKKICVIITKEGFERRRREQYVEPQWYLDHIWDSYYRYQGRYEEVCDLVLDGERALDSDSVLRFIDEG